MEYHARQVWVGEQDMNGDSRDQDPYPAPAYSWYVVGVLYLAYTLAFVDRQIMAFIVGPIRAYFHLTDFQFSLLHGLAFVLFYSVLGVPIARLADRRSRRRIVAVGIGLWSCMTVLCGLAGTYLQLFLARLGVGVGEATLSPSAVSLIADYFPREKRALPIGLYSAGVHGGAGLASIGGGLIVTFAMTGGAARLPLLGQLQAWQVALVLVGLPGLAVAALSLSIREPVRRERHAALAVDLSGGALFAYLRRHVLVYGTLMLGAGFAALASYGAFSWVPALFMRRWGWSAADIGIPFGIATFLFGTAGMLGSGMAANALVKAGVSAAYTRLMIGNMACAVVPAALLVVYDDPYWSLGCVSLMVLFLSGPIGLVQTALQAITPNEVRGQIIAVYLLVVTLVGLAGGPSLVAALTDYWFHNDAAVGSSIAVVGAGASVVSALVLLLGVGAYRRKVESGHA
jgi:MFS family permease